MKIARNGFPRRALAILMALLLTVQLLPAALAAEDGEGAAEENSSDTVPGTGDSMSIDGQAQDAATATGTAGEDVTWSYYADTKTLVLSGAGATDDYDNPERAPWYPQSNEDKPNYQAELTCVVVENDVTRLGNRLFINAKKLTSITIASSVTEIGEKVFMNCTALTSITIPEGVKSVGENAFNGCTSLTEVKLPASLETIGDGAFTKCASLASIQYAGTVAQYQELAEKSAALQSADYQVTCSDGTYTYGEVPEMKNLCGENVAYRLDDLGNGTYELVIYPVDSSKDGRMEDFASETKTPWAAQKDAVVSLKVESGVTYLGQWAFRGMASLAAAEIPESVTGIGAHALRETGLTSIEIPGKITTLGRAAFYKCTDLQSVSLPQTALLSDFLFNGCTSLKRLTIPAGVTVKNEGNIDSLIFHNCNSLTEIEFLGTKEQYKAFVAQPTPDDSMDALKSAGITVHCTDGDFVWGTQVIGGLTCTVSGGTMTINGSGAIPENVQWDAEVAQITTLVLKNGVTSIGAGAFADFTNLKTVCYVGTSEEWEMLMAQTGDNNDPLRSAALSLTASGACGENASWSISGDGTVLTIQGSGPMQDYRSAKEAPWYRAADTITTLVVDSGITTLGDYAFTDMKQLTRVELPETLTRLGCYTFGGCVGLAEITIPEGVRILAAKAFSGCAGLTSIALPASLEAVDMKAFNYDSGLKTATYAGSADQWARIWVSNSAKGNQNLLDALVYTGAPETAAQAFADVAGSEWFAGALDGLLTEDLLTRSEQFEPDAPADQAMAAEILYRRAGSPGMYAGGMDYAWRNGLTEDAANGRLTLDGLCRMLAAAAGLNGCEVTGDAVAWAQEQGILPAQLSGKTGGEPLTRAETAAAMASYLTTSAAAVDRRDAMLAQVKAALAAGGDGNIYILAPDLRVPNITAKTGDCTLVVFPQGTTMLIDSGLADSEDHVLGMLRELELTHLDYFLLTHPHTDHAGNALAVGEYIYGAGGTVDHYLYSGYQFNKDTETKIWNFFQGKDTDIDRNVTAGKTLTIDGVTLEVFGPSQEEAASGSTDDEFVNNVSILLKLTYGGSTYLTGGDLYISQELKLIQRWGSQLQADVVKCNHHGLYTSNSREWLDTVQPKLLLTENDDVGSSVLAETASREVGAAYYSAGIDGDVLIVMDNGGHYQVTSQYDSDLRKDYTGTIGLPQAPVLPVTPPAPVVPVLPVTPVPAPSGQPEDVRPAVRFQDVGQEAWYCEAVTAAAELGLMNGVAPERFAPEAEVSRAMVWTILGRMALAQVDGGQPWYSLAQSWAMAQGVSDGTAPDRGVTREELAAMLYRFAGEPALTDHDMAALTAFPDWEEVSPYAAEAMAWAVSRGVINGADGRLAPKSGATRAQMAAMLVRYIGASGK